MAKDDQGVSRRSLVFSLVPSGVAAAGLTGGAAALLFPPAPRQPGRVRRACRVADMDVGGQVTLDENVLVVRDVGGLHAISLVCTHLGCALTRHEQGFQCHCHGSLFNDEGQPLIGPATRALPWYHVLLHDGWVLVDLDRQVSPGTLTSV